MECPAVVPDMRWEKISTAMERVPEVKDAEERDRKEIFEDAIFAKKKELDEGRRIEATNAQAKFKALLAQIEGKQWREQLYFALQTATRQGLKCRPQPSFVKASMSPGRGIRPWSICKTTKVLKAIPRFR